MVKAHRVVEGLHTHGLLTVVAREELVVVGLATLVRGPGSGKAHGLHVIVAYDIASQTQTIKSIGVVGKTSMFARIRTAGKFKDVKVPVGVFELNGRVGELRRGVGS